MLTVLVCVQSSCNQPLAKTVLSRFQALAAQHGIEDQVQISPSDCLGVCNNGVTVQIGQHLYTGIAKDTMDVVFHHYVLDLLKEHT